MKKRQAWRKRDNFVDACRHAVKGVKLSWLEELNIRIQLVIAVIVLTLAIGFGLSGVEVAIILLMSAIVMGLEMINTAIEDLGDIIQPEYDEKMGQIKDVAAGAVLMASVVAVLVGLVIFIPYI